MIGDIALSLEQARQLDERCRGVTQDDVLQTRAERVKRTAVDFTRYYQAKWNNMPIKYYIDEESHYGKWQSFSEFLFK